MATPAQGSSALVAGTTDALHTLHIAALTLLPAHPRPTQATECLGDLPAAPTNASMKSRSRAGVARAAVARASARAAAVRAVAATAVARAVPVASLEPAATDGRGLVGLDGCEVCLCDPCARVRPCVPCVSRLPPVSFYRYKFCYAYSA